MSHKPEAPDDDQPTYPHWSAEPIFRGEDMRNSDLRRLIGRLVANSVDEGIGIHGILGWSAEVFEVEAPRRVVGVEVFRCNWVDLHYQSRDPLWSGMAQVGIPNSDYGRPMLIVQAEDFSRIGLPGELVVDKIHTVTA
jgi:hypothetical protein